MQVADSKPRIKLSNCQYLANIRDLNQLKNHQVYEVQDISLNENQLCYMVIGEKDTNDPYLPILQQGETNAELLLENDELFVNGLFCCRFTSVELQAFCYLNSHRGKPVSRDDLYNTLYRDEREPFCRRIDNLISSMRKKVEKNQLIPELIVTVRHKGYMLK